MGDFNRDEREAAENLKKLDFSKYSKAHMNKLWDSLNTRSGARSLLDDDGNSLNIRRNTMNKNEKTTHPQGAELKDDELDGVAGGTGNTGKKPIIQTSGSCGYFELRDPSYDPGCCKSCTYFEVGMSNFYCKNPLNAV